VNLRAFAGRIANTTNVPASSIETVLRAAIATLSDELAAAGRFEWRGLGTFAVRSYPGRKIHNPATGKTIRLPARRSVAFKPSARLRSKLKPPTRQPRRSSMSSR
jgi:DNA-binding protein HU-beta